MAAPELDRFGSFLITNLRDSALNFLDGLLKWHWKSPSTQQLQANLADLSEEQREIVRRCVVACVDRGIHDFLFALGISQDFEEGISVLVDGKNIAELSDGLQGEMFGEHGWIAKFANHPPDEKR